MHRLLPVNVTADIPAALRDTPVAHLLEFHNLNRPFRPYTRAELLIGMCMDNRAQLHIPDNFAFILRTGGANLRFSEFKVSFAIAIGGVEHIALIGHTDCGMVGLMNKRARFVDGLVEHAGWDREYAEDHFMNFAPMFEIGNEVDFIISSANHIRSRYPKIAVTPMLFKVEDRRLYLIAERSEN